MDLGASRRGSAMGPAALRAAGLGSLLKSLGYDIEDHGDISGRELHVVDEPPPPNVKHYREIQAWTRALSARAYTLARSGTIPVFLGGDHSISMGSINGVARHWREVGRELFVLWLDAHADYNTPVTTLSGNMHGMSAAFLCGEPGLDQFLGDEQRASIGYDQLDLFGARSIDKLERQLLHDRGVHLAAMPRISDDGIGILIERVIDKVKRRNGVLHVSFDADVLDPEIAPGVGTPEPGGLNYHQAHLVMNLLRESNLVQSLDLVELNPLLDRQGRTARIMVELVGALFDRRPAHMLAPAEVVAKSKR